MATQAMVIHSPIRVHLGPLRRILNDSRFHRVHHSLERRHFGKNYGTGFTIWDQLFGPAYFPKADEWPDVGLEGLPSPRRPAEILLYLVRLVRRSDAPVEHVSPGGDAVQRCATGT